MLVVDNTELEVNHFPDGSQMMLNCEIDKTIDIHTIVWKYENDEEIVRLIYLVNHIRNVSGTNAKIKLYMPYINSARMDRVKNSCEVFTLKWFAKIINDLNFEEVHVYDAHSNVSLGLIDRVYTDDSMLRENIQYALNSDEIDMVYFPDESAMKRYRNLIGNDVKVVYGSKVRDWETGRITGLTVKGENGLIVNTESNCILIIDDIISKGGSINFGIEALIKYGKPKGITIYASHIENSLYEQPLWNAALWNGYKIIGTDSIVHSESMKNVEIFEELKLKY